LEALDTALRRLHTDRDLLAGVLTGAGEAAFCAGADLDPDTAFQWDYTRPNAPVADLVRLARSAPVPLIARVNGACMAGGLALAAACPLAIAADDVQFGIPEVKVGIFPMQVFATLQPLVGPKLLYEWCVTGEPFGAQAAKEAGLLNAVVPRAQLDERLGQLLARITDKSPVAIRRGVYAMQAASSMGFEQSLAYMESQVSTISLTEDAKEGVAAFAQKRKPLWKGR
jgi:enoyl-CoA hydratase/carnithine racemase